MQLWVQDSDFSVESSGQSSNGQLLASLDRLLVQIVTAASAIMGSREEDFLALGARLQEYAGSVADLTRHTSHLAELASGEEIEAGAQDLSAELERMRGMVGAETSSRSLRELDSILEVSRRLDSLTQDFRRIVKKLQMLGISTRIESARLGSQGHGFTTLADDVDKLASSIVIHSAKIIGKSQSLCELVSSVRERTTSILAMQECCSAGVFSSIESNLDSLRELARKSNAISVELPDMTRGISREIGEVVSSLQFHDIVRQQVEHVAEAMEAGIEQLSPHVGRQALEPDGQEVVGWLAGVCTLQSSQLHNASETLASAVERLREHMRGIALHAGEIGRALTRAVSTGSDSGENVLELIEQSMRQIMDSMLEYAGQGEQAGTIMRDVASTISEMSAFVSDIEEVGSEIELIALNASVKAAHTGDEGRALGVLAQAIQHLSVEARAQTEAVSSVLTRIAQASEALLENADKYLDRSQVDDMLGRMEGLTSHLRLMNAQFDSRLTSVKVTVDDLARSIEETVEAVDFHHEIDWRIEQSRTLLKQAGAEARRLVPQSQDVGRSERLKAMLDRYTMDAERIIHLNTLGHGEARESLYAMPEDSMPARSGQTVESGQADDGQGDLGDNVELF